MIFEYLITYLYVWERDELWFLFTYLRWTLVLTLFAQLEASDRTNK